MKDFDHLSEWTDRITPCTTVPTSPYSEDKLIDFKVYAKMKLVQEFEQKVLDLQKIIAYKTLDLNQRMVTVQNKDRYNWVKRQKINEKHNKSSVIPDLTNFETQELDLISEDLHNKVIFFESQTQADTLKLQSLQEKFSEYSLIKQLTERRISDINRKLLTLYRKKQEKTEEYHQINAEKTKILQVSGTIQNNLVTLKLENSKIFKKQAANEKKKRILNEQLKDTEIQKNRIFKLKFYIDSENPKINCTLCTLNQLSDKNTQIVEKIRKKIMSVENLAEKIQVQEKLLNLRKDKIQQESSRIFQKSTEILQLLKLLELKNSELDKEFENSEKKQKSIQNKIFEIKENKESEEKQASLLEKLQKIRSQGK